MTEVVALFSISMTSKMYRRDNSIDYHGDHMLWGYAIGSAEYEHEKNGENDRLMTEMSVE